MEFLANIFSNTIIAFIILVGIVVIIHELGHFLVGKFFKIGVEEFSVGFGPKAFGFKKGETTYNINWLPLGGYVRFYGSDLEQEIPPENYENSILHAKLYKRVLVSFAGPFANFILAFVIMFILYSFGVTKQPPVFSVLNHSVAQSTGLESGDKIISINDQKILDWSALMKTINESPNKKLTLEIERNQKRSTIVLTPKSEKVETVYGSVENVGRIGVTPFFSEPNFSAAADSFIYQLGVNHKKITAIDQSKIFLHTDFFNKLKQITGSELEIIIAENIKNKRIPQPNFTLEYSDNLGAIQNKIIDLYSLEFKNWSKNLLANKSELKNKSSVEDTPLSELQIASYTNTLANDKFYSTQKKLSDCGLKSGDTIYKVDNSALFTQQIDLLTFLEEKYKKLNQVSAEFITKDSLNFRFFIFDPLGIKRVITCDLPIRKSKNHLNQDKMFFDFPVKFVTNPILFSATKIKGINFLDSIKLASKDIAFQATIIYQGLKKLFSGGIPLSNIGGPIAIAGFAGEAAKAGFETFLLAISLISVNIGIFNLLPFPALDGGTLLLQGIEFIYGKRLSKKTQMMVARLGIMFVLALFVLVFYNDIIRLFHGY